MLSFFSVEHSEIPPKSHSKSLHNWVRHHSTMKWPWLEVERCNKPPLLIHEQPIPSLLPAALSSWTTPTLQRRAQLNHVTSCSLLTHVKYPLLPFNQDPQSHWLCSHAHLISVIHVGSVKKSSKLIPVTLQYSMDIASRTSFWCFETRCDEQGQLLLKLHAHWLMACQPQIGTQREDQK